MDIWLPKVRGLVIVELDGHEVFRGENLFVNAGYARMAQFLANKAPAAPTYVAVGNGNGSGAVITPAPADTTLGFEVLRKAATSLAVLGTYTTRIGVTFTAAEAQGVLTEMGLFDAAGDTGTSSGSNTTTTLNDTTKSWTPNQWAGWTVYITAGTGAGQKRTISSNTATLLIVSTAWTTTPDATSKYTIGGVGASQFMFARASINVNKGAQSMNVIWQLTQPAG